VTRRLCCVLSGILLGAAQAPPPPPHPPIRAFLDAASTDERVAARALDQIEAAWRPSYTGLLIDVARFLPRSGADLEVFSFTDDGVAASGASRGLPSSAAARARARLVRFLGRQTGQRFGDDLGRWREWMWKLPYEPHPDHAAFKRELYGRVDPRMRAFFPDAVAAAIRLDEIDWGGVRVNGIPPLVAPRTIPAPEATYLRDNHIVFGLVVNGEARAYPRRVLAWHELARDQVGGVDLTVVYCTLCGTVIPYESVVGGKRFTFGTSGLLYRSNKLLFDEETATLWSTLDGTPAVGGLVGSGLRLRAHPVVTTTWAEWRREHPGTRVLSLETGHDRDYSEGAAYRDYFSTDRLMFRVPFRDNRLKNKDEVLALLLPAPGGGRLAAAFDVRLLARQPVFQADLEGRRVVVVTSAGGANRVYDAGRVDFTGGRLAGEHVTDGRGTRWVVSEEALTEEGSGRRLPRLAAARAFWFGWFAQFPETLLFR
jgi:hypothetical protein